MKLVGLSLAMALLLALAGCNIAVSDKPVFGEAQRSTVRLKDGYWVIAEQGCKYDSTKPVDSWPGCADWIVIAGNQIVRERDKNVFGVEPALLIAVGEPLIMQIFSKSERGEQPFYSFGAIEPKAATPGGEVAAMQVWVVECGADSSHHYPGFDTECRPGSSDALRAAATASRPQENEMIVAKWVRATK